MGDATVRTAAEWSAACDAMSRAGTQRGKAAGRSIADGAPTEQTLRAILRQWEAGDPAGPQAPRPFAGRDGMTLTGEILEYTDCDPGRLTDANRDELAAAYDDGYAPGWQNEAKRTVRAYLGAA